MKDRILSGIQPSRGLTLGNYLGALRPWEQWQREADCLFFVVNLHAITVPQDPEALRHQTEEAVATYLACGIDPSLATVFIQSEVPAHSELTWILTCFSGMGELSRMTQFKDKSAQFEHIPVGLLVYPVLMAADILLYQTHRVPVGEDQQQHLELARDLAERMNKKFQAPLFKIPQAWIPKVGARIKSLQDPLKKMSKSDSNLGGTLFLRDSADVLRKKIRRAVTDSLGEIRDHPDQPGVQNLLQIQAAMRGVSVAQVVEELAGQTYGVLKERTAEEVIEGLRPIQERLEELLKSRDFLRGILKRGQERANGLAQETLHQVQRAVGLRF